MVRNEIALLNQETIDKIAAGEVVERPSSVVKELVENAIDAGATAITVEIKDGGITLLRITDNGYGIPKEEIPLAFLRHTTNKIRSASELLSLHTLGFRGEALSSIAAVSKVELITKTKDALIGSRYVIEGAKELSLEEMGAPDGTTFFVRQLFYNTPARRKFLKSPMTEGNYIQELLERLALSNPSISFRFISNGKDRFATAGNGNLKDTIYELYGREIASSLIEISAEEESFSLHGFIGTPALNRGNRNFESFFVNGRYIKSGILSKSLEEGYAGFLMQHQYPFAVLMFDFADNGVDVNVHPSKLEVRFENSNVVYNTLLRTVHDALAHREDIDVVPVVEEEDEVIAEATPILRAEPFEASRLQSMKDSIVEQIHKDTPYEAQYKEFYENKRKESVAEEIVYHAPTANVGNEQTSFFSEEARADHRIIGQVFGTYWLVEYDGKLYIIDQHAAHEKVLFEKTMARLHEKTMTSQMVNPPIIVTLSTQEEEAFEKYQESFETLGYQVEHFGGKEYALTAVPDNILNLDKRQLFLDAISACVELKEDKTSELILERIASMSCKAAVKGNHVLSMPEIESLIDELLSLDNPFRCPHGRPTIIAMTHYELDKKFKRIV
ncbi:MAG: DNA mismatch repair endonuclease MutL [Lachnospiraceae bacterium]|nr:DNA mismatch repair endonuclease MutL [Lachnospiraceae bacterium]MBQ2502831.1 DNA mismatch repair endonuclease MutL [Lachnospiraceae bacterium]